MPDCPHHQGRPVTIFTVTPEEALCGFSAVVDQVFYYASAVAATDTTAIRIPRTEFAGLLRHRPGFALAVLAIYHTHMRHMAETISLAPASVEQRLAYTLLRLKSIFHNEAAGLDHIVSGQGDGLGSTEVTHVAPECQGVLWTGTWWVAALSGHYQKHDLNH